MITVTILASLNVQSAPRSTPVTVVNDAATPVPVEVISGAGGSYVYVGPSNATTLPKIGHIGMNSVYANTYAGSRMCSTAELIQNFSPTTIPNLDMWVNPSFTQGIGGDGRPSDVSGYANSIGQQTQCGSWSTNRGDYTGFIFKGNSNGGFITKAACDASLYVSCCAFQHR